MSCSCQLIIKESDDDDQDSFDESRKFDVSGDFPWLRKCPEFTSVILVDAVGWVISRTSDLYKNLVIYPQQILSGTSGERNQRWNH